MGHEFVPGLLGLLDGADVAFKPLHHPLRHVLHVAHAVQYLPRRRHGALHGFVGYRLGLIDLGQGLPKLRKLPAQSPVHLGDELACDVCHPVDLGLGLA